MAATLIQIADGLAERLSTVRGLRVYDHVPDVWATPCAWMMPETVEYWNSFGGGDVQHVYSITLVVGRTADRQNQKALYEFMGYSGDRSIRAAIEGDRTLGGRVQTLLVERADNIQIISQGDASYLSCDFRCRIHA
jgi:hypothetical protein